MTTAITGTTPTTTTTTKKPTTTTKKTTTTTASAGKITFTVYPAYIKLIFSP